MENLRSRVEQRLARLLTTTPPPTPGAATEATPRIDFVYAGETDRSRLEDSVRD